MAASMDTAAHAHAEANAHEGANDSSAYAPSQSPTTHDAAHDAYDEDDEDDEDDTSLYALHNLVEQGGVDALRALLPLQNEVVKPNEGDEDSEDEARCHARSMQVLAAESALLEKDDMGCLPIHIAVIYQRLDCALHVLRYSEALTSAMLRLKCGDLNTPIVHLVLRVGAVNPSFATRLITQLFNDDEGEEDTLAQTLSEDVKALLFEKMVAKDEEGNTVFHLCAMYDLHECLATFAGFYARQAAANDRTKDDDEKSKDKKETMSTIKPLLEKANRVGFRPLHAAMKFQSAHVAQQLVTEYNVNVNATTTLQQTPAHIAALAGFAGGIALLLGDSSRVDWTLQDSHGYTAVQLAQKAKFREVVRLLVPEENAENEEKEGEDAAKAYKTKFFFHPESLRHLPNAYHRRGGAEPPPENPERMDTLVDPLFGILRSQEFQKPHIEWDHDIAPADIADVLRVHEFHYVDKIRKACAQLSVTASSNAPVNGNDDGDEDEDEEECGKTYTLDADTALSLRSYEAATRAAGAVCKAVDDVVSGACTNAFCIVRPPGHHAGPVGKVVCANDPEGSHGFCVFNNVAIGAAYARAQYKRQGIHRIAILDFDVHHGNGTEEIVRQLVPRTAEVAYATPYGEGKQLVHQFKPWRSEDDARNVFFSSVHGYGHKDPEHDHLHKDAAWFYPGSGETNQVGDEDNAPLIYNIGLGYCHEGTSASRLQWRSAFRDDVLVKLRKFAPDLILLSAGFDAHKRENVNWGYVSLLEQDYEWLVAHVRRVAHACCHGRLVSVLEGGYNFHGRMVSPFARSVAAHARALVLPTHATWDADDVAKEAAHERVLLASYTTTTATVTASVTMVEATRKKRHSGTETKTQDEDEPKEVPMAVSRSKRARKDVDYVALAEELAQRK